MLERAGPGLKNLWVQPLKGSSALDPPRSLRFAIVEFGKDWPGFSNAITFDKAFEADHHGKHDYKGI